MAAAVWALLGGHQAYVGQDEEKAGEVVRGCDGPEQRRQRQRQRRNHRRGGRVWQASRRIYMDLTSDLAKVARAAVPVLVTGIEGALRCRCSPAEEGTFVGRTRPLLANLNALFLTAPASAGLAKLVANVASWRWATLAIGGGLWRVKAMMAAR